MLHNISKFFTLRQLGLPVVGLWLGSGAIALGIVGEQSQPVLSQPIEKTLSKKTSILSRFREIQAERSEFTSKNLDQVKIATKEPGEVLTGNLPKKDGIYLYGQSPKPNQLGQGYIIFQKQQDQVMGALYMPQSEFSCFQGTLNQAGELAMTVTSSPGERGDIEVSTASTIPRVKDDESLTYAYSVTLKDYHQLKYLSANDQKILQMCTQPSVSSYTKLVK